MPDPTVPVDLSKRWTQHLRDHANTTLSYACPYCPDRKIQHSEEDLWKHVNSSHGNQIPSSDDRAAIGEFRRNLRIRAAEKAPKPQKPTTTRIQTGNPKALTLQSKDPQSATTTNQSKRPFSSPTDLTQASEISRMKDLNLENDQNSLIEDTPDDTELEPQPKRPAIGEGESPSSSLRARDSQSPPRRSKAARPSSASYNKKIETFDYNRDNKVMSSVQQQSIRPAPPGRRIWNPDTDALPKQSIDSPSNRGLGSGEPQLNAGLKKANANKSLGRRDRRPHQSAGQNLTSQSVSPAKDQSDHSMTQRPASSHAPTTYPVSILGSKSSNPVVEDSKHLDIILQPETRPISQEQLVAEVKGIYAGLVMVEAKCIEVDNKHAAQGSDPESLSKINHEKWQALISLHRTLLHEHHDFFLASQHPSASPALRRLASKYAMPARMWRHGIHSFLELLRHRLPASLDHMLAFIYLAYSMMALLYETVPAFEDTWIECLGDLGRYRMAIEDDDIRDREVWTGVARHWYSKASDKSPTTGRLYHHLAILARPNALQQLFYYAKSLCVLGPFTSARESILTLFEPILKPATTANHRSPPSDTTFVRAHGILFTRTHLEKFKEAVDEFTGQLDNHIGRISRRFMEQGYFVAVANSVALLGFGADDNCLMAALAKSDAAVAESFKVENLKAEPSKSFEDAQELNSRSLEVVLRRLGDPNVLPYIHVTLVFMHHLSRVEGAIKLLESAFPWHLLVIMLNTLLRTSITSERFESDTFPIPEKDDPRPFPEDFALRGLLWADKLFPENWFANPRVDDEEKYLELPSMTAERKERILWLACRIASAGPWLRYNSEEQKFTSPRATAEICSETERESSTDSCTLCSRPDDEPNPISHTLTWASQTTQGDEFWDTPSQRSDTGLTGLTEADETASEHTKDSDDVEFT